MVSFTYNALRVNQTIAAYYIYMDRGRKVRAPKSRVPGNAWAAQADDKCSREKTADGLFASTGKAERVR